jgi:uncharacterized protein (DUF58 family)
MAAVFDDEFRRRLEVLKRLVARALAGRGGAGRSPLHERGGRVEFADHRAYSPGDDSRAIDWHAYARLGALVVKEFEAPRESHLLLLLDLSASMRMLGKAEAALRLAAALGWLGLAAGARVACASAGGASRFVASVERFHDLLDALERLPGAVGADLPEAVRRAPPHGAGPRTCVVLSDLYEAAPFAAALAALARRSAESVVAHVLAPEELRPPEGLAARLVDAESGEALDVALTPEARARFAREADAFLKERAAIAARHGARYLRVAPGDDLVVAVERVFLAERAA